MKKHLSLILCLAFCFAMSSVFSTNVPAAEKPKRAVSCISPYYWSWTNDRWLKTDDNTVCYYYYYGNNPKKLKIPRNAMLTDGSDLKNLESLVVPKNIEMIGYIESDRLKEVNIGMAQVRFPSDGPYSYFRAPNLTKYIADKRNFMFYTKDGVLYSYRAVEGKTRSLKQIYSYPAKKKGSYYEVDKSSRLVGGTAFWNNHYLKKIVIPAGARPLELSFYKCKNLKELAFNGPVILNHGTGGYGISSCPKLTRIVMNHKQAGFEIFTEDEGIYESMIRDYKEEYKNVTFYVKPHSRALSDVREIGLKYKIIA